MENGKGNSCQGKTQISLEPERSQGEDWFYLTVALDLYSPLLIG